MGRYDRIPGDEGRKRKIKKNKEKDYGIHYKTDTFLCKIYLSAPDNLLYNELSDK